MLYSYNQIFLLTVLYYVNTFYRNLCSLRPMPAFRGSLRSILSNSVVYFVSRHLKGYYSVYQNNALTVSTRVYFFLLRKHGINYVLLSINTSKCTYMIQYLIKFWKTRFLKYHLRSLLLRKLVIVLSQTCFFSPEYTGCPVPKCQIYYHCFQLSALIDLE